MSATAAPLITEVEKGQAIGSRSIGVSRADLIRYAAASGDPNPIHWNDRFAREVGLGGVIAHGMLTMGLAVDLVSEWAGDPGAVVDYQARFAKPVPVPEPAEGSPEQATAALEVSGIIGAVDLENSTARVDLTVTVLPVQEAGAEIFGNSPGAPVKVLAKSQAQVRLRNTA